MIDIIKHIQENYVPQVKLEDGTIEVKNKMKIKCYYYFSCQNAKELQGFTY